MNKTFLNEKKNELVFFAVNFCVMLPVFIKNATPVGAAVFLLFNGLLWNTLAKKKTGEKGMCARLPFFILLDIAMSIGIRWDLLYGSYHISLIGITRLSVSALFLFIAGLVLIVFGWKRNKALGRIFFWLGNGALAVCAILLYFGSGSLYSLAFVQPGIMFLAFFGVMAVLWIAACQVSELGTPAGSGSKAKHNLMSILLIGLLWAFCILEYDLVWAYMSDLPRHLDEFAHAYLSWPYLLGVVLVTAAGFYACRDKKSTDTSNDSLLVLALGGLIFVFYGALAWYFTYNWALVLLYLAGSVFILQNKLKIVQEFRFERAFLQLLLTACVLLSMACISVGLGMLVVFLLPACYLLACFKGERGSFRYWCMVLLAAGAAAFGWIWQFRQSKDNVQALLVILFFAILAMYLICSKHPAGIVPLFRIRAGVAAAAVILMLIPMIRMGSKISVREPEYPEKGYVTIELQANGKSNELASASYCWSDGRFQKTSEEIPLAGGETVLSIENECLTITAIDKNGVKTVRKYWYPYVFENKTVLSWK